MNGKKQSCIGLWQLFGFGAVSLLGTLLHFLYEWTGENKIAALFSGVNESTWEHMKLLFFPMFFYAILESFFVSKDHPNFWCVKLRGSLLGILLIPTLFYTINGIFGKTPDFVNITIFFLSAAIAFLYETLAFQKEPPLNPRKGLSLTVLCAIALLFFLFTFFVPEIPLFQDPLSGTYGV